MPVEIEAKMKLADLPGMQAKLRKLGAAPGRVVLETNMFFDRPEHPLRDEDKGLRIRSERDQSSGGEQVTMTFKGPRLDSEVKQRPEHEIVVSDADTASQLLQGLGFAPTLSFEKKRQHWQLDECIIVLDTLPYLGDFIEIEGPSERSVRELRERVGLGDQPMISDSYIAMLMDHRAEHGINDTFISL